MKQGKVWGQTEELLRTPLIEVHRIKINPNMQCSMHKHNQKWNMFYVIEGELAIEVEKNDYALVDTTVLRTGEWTSVKPGEYHRFRSLDVPVVALEIYYLEPLFTDIVRKDVGGSTDVSLLNLDSVPQQFSGIVEGVNGVDEEQLVRNSGFEEIFAVDDRSYDLTGRDSTSDLTD